MDLRILNLTEENLALAARVLRSGGLIGLPTETVYGLAADAANEAAIERIYEAKGRPKFNPLIAHVSDIEMAQREGVFRPEALALVEAHWPGPLTVVVDVAPTGTVSKLARAGLDSVALRIPAHAIPINLVETFGGPLVAPSANPSGKISPTTLDHVMQDMGDKLDLIFNGGTCAAGIESTIIDARGERPALLRPGSLNPDWIEEIWPGLIRPDLNPAAPRSPGQLLRHYAPRAELRLNANAPEPGEAYLGFGPGAATLNLSERGDLDEAAKNLFSMLRELDQNYDRIAVAPIPTHGLGEGINDRLTRAAK
ncbi:MAG: L-threonylcarbamoyladenylate synthase [Hyphomonadaceae bacterium]|nr:L-threonylcarbamoyladenylate synthase [Hyphomonadaceae bacterium]